MRESEMNEQDYISACWMEVMREDDEDMTIPLGDRYFANCYHDELPVWQAVDSLKIQL